VGLSRGSGSVERDGSVAPDRIDAMSPPGYPGARLLSSIAGFRFARPDQFNAAIEEQVARR
jgi:hypothetical protein